ncbi:MAG: site-specific DNA-methyltransferase [Bacteroidetes bacterium]|nr:site-specific DNA-methyltransferase [Bacteroidota bacterium]
MNEKSNIEALNPLLQQALVSGSAVFNMDCIEFMKQVPDKFFHLAIVDPPYGIGAGSVNFQSGTRKRPSKFHKQNDWDTSIPAPEYWEQLFRVSKNQIVFGGNYMTDFLPPSRCWIFWDKGTGDNSYADGELAWTSFDKVVKKFSKFWSGGNAKEKFDIDRIHPTQKPIQLYEWIIKEFMSEGNLILDTHLGSGGSRIAAHKAGKIFVGTEIDKDYFEMQEKRWKNFTAQTVLF